MLRTTVDQGYRVEIPEALRDSLHVGDEFFVTITKTGQILLIPARRVDEILDQTAGMWQDREDIPADSLEYVNQIRQG